MDSGENFKKFILRNDSTVADEQKKSPTPSKEIQSKNFTPVTNVKPEGALTKVRQSIVESAVEHNTTTYEVKLFHPHEDGNNCQYKGQTVRFDVSAGSTSELRTKIESNVHEFFKGDCCKKCGALAKVSFR